VHKKEPMIYYHFNELCCSFVSNFPLLIEESLVMRSFIDNAYENTKAFLWAQIPIYALIFVLPHFIQMFGELEGGWAKVCLSIAMFG